MSVATAFLHLGAFPVCIPNVSLPATFDYVGGLSLADAMAFYWNLEDVEIATAGTSGTADAGGAVNFDPPTRSGAFVNNTEWEYPVDGSMLRLQSTPVSFASLPSTTYEPYERVCCTQFVFNFNVTDDGTADLDLIHQVQWEMYLNIDPGDSTKYAVYYRFVIRAGSFGSDTVAFCNPSRGSQSSSGSFTTGTFTIAGITFDWRCYYNGSVTGESLSTTGTIYTY